MIGNHRMSVSISALTLVILMVEVSLAYQPLDGTGNNVDNPDWGSVGRHFEFITAPPAYADGVQAPARPDGPNERNVSMKLFTLPFEWNRRGINDLLPYWGQFICHDIAIFDTNASEPINIPVDRCDHYFDPNCLGNQSVGVTRNEGRMGPNGYRVSVNRQTEWIDGSVIYGVDEARLAWFRTGSGGLLKTSQGPNGELLPLNLESMNNAGGSDRTNLFIAGDVRCNANLPLLSLHTLMHLEHNRRARELASRNPTWDDEKLFQEARRFIIGLQQKITFKEYLPKLLGKPLPDYTGYNSSINPNIDVNFMTTAFRYGHSSVNKWVYRYRDDGFPNVHGPLEVGETIFNPFEVRDNGIDEVLRGAAVLPESEADVSLVAGIRNNQYLADLGAVDIARGRERGITDYNSLRESLGMDRVTSFEEINADPTISRILRDLYGHVDNIDPWIGGLAERPIPRGIISPMFNELVFRQFQNLRDGDRYYYENEDEYDEELRKEIRGRLLSELVVEHTNITFYQADAFAVVPVKRRSGSSSSDLDYSYSPFDDYTIHWSIRDETFWDVQLSLAGATSTNAWIAVGFGTQMRGSDFVMCYFDESETAVVQDWWFGPMVQFPSPDESQGRSDDIIPDSVYGEFINGILTFKFSRKMTSSDSLDAKIPLGATSMLFAYNLIGSPTRQPEYHGPANRKVAILNLASGTSTETQGAFLRRPLAALYITHGITMMLAWLVLMPSSIFVIRYLPLLKYGEDEDNGSDSSTRRQSRVALHRVLAQCGVAAVVAVSAAVLLSGGGGYVFFRHTHSILGVIILCIMVVETVLGLAIATLQRANEDEEENEEEEDDDTSDTIETLKKAHQAVGAILCCLGFWNVYHGMMLLWAGSSTAAAIYFTWVAILFGFCFFHEGLRFGVIKGKAESKEAEYSQGKTDGRP